MPQLKNKDLLLKIGAALGLTLLLLGVCLTAAFNCARLHYDNQRLSAELNKLRQDALWKKYPSAPEPLEYLDAEGLRLLGEKQGLDFVSSKHGDSEQEFIFTGGYAAFLSYLRALAEENCGELTQININETQKIVLKGGSL